MLGTPFCQKTAKFLKKIRKNQIYFNASTRVCYTKPEQNPCSISAQEAGFVDDTVLWSWTTLHWGLPT